MPVLSLKTIVLGCLNGGGKDMYGLPGGTLTKTTTLCYWCVLSVLK